MLKKKKYLAYWNILKDFPFHSIYHFVDISNDTNPLDFQNDYKVLHIMYNFYKNITMNQYHIYHSLTFKVIHVI